jgi:hypothetical protein
MKKTLLLFLVCATPALSMNRQVGLSWSWKSIVSALSNTVREKPALIGLGAVALAAAAYSVYSFCKTQKPEMERPRPQHLHSDQEYKPVTDTLSKISPDQQKQLKPFLQMLKKAAESDLFRLECMLKENMIGSVSFDCLHVWDMHKELAAALPLRTIKDYTVFVRGFSTEPLTTEKDVQQAYANVKSLQEAVEAFMKN